MADGIRTRHSRGCPSQNGGECRTTHLAGCATKKRGADRGPCDCGRCTPSYEAAVWSVRDGKKIRKTFSDVSAAKSWRVDMESAKKARRLPRASSERVGEACTSWLEKATVGVITLPSSEARYKPKVLRVYESDLRRYVVPELGSKKLAELSRHDVQRLVEDLRGRGLSGSRIRGIIMPLRAVCRRAIRDERITVNPTTDLELPANSGIRDRVATPDELERLLAAVPASDRPIWATAAYAGLRRGELRALRWSAIDVGVTVIRVEHGWDDVEGEIAPKSANGFRTVPIVGTLRQLLLEHQVATGRRGDDLVFGSTASRPFTPTNIRLKAIRAWEHTFACGCTRARGKPKKDETRDAKGQLICPEHRVGLLTPIGLHECRHTYVSLMFDAGFPLERIGDYVGHAAADMVDRYRHLLDGHEAEAAARFDAYLESRTGAQSGAQASVTKLQPARLNAK